MEQSKHARRSLFERRDMITNERSERTCSEIRFPCEISNLTAYFACGLPRDRACVNQIQGRNDKETVFEREHDRNRLRLTESA